MVRWLTQHEALVLLGLLLLLGILGAVAEKWLGG